MWSWIGKIAGALIVGVLLGLLHFGGLWWTVRKMPTSRRPYLLMSASFVVRLGVTLGVLMLAVQIDWILAMACLAVMILTRSVLTAKLGRLPEVAPTIPDGSDDES